MLFVIFEVRFKNHLNCFRYFISLERNCAFEKGNYAGMGYKDSRNPFAKVNEFVRAIFHRSRKHNRKLYKLIQWRATTDDADSALA